MSRGINKVILVANLGDDPTVRYSQNGTAMANLTVATSEQWKDKQTGEQRENTEWHRVVLYRRLAEIAGEYLKKGSKVYIEGKLQTRKWQDKDGKDRYTTEIVASEMQMLDSASQVQQHQQGGYVQQQKRPAQGYGYNQQQPNPQAPQQQSQQQPGGDFDDGIPF